VADAVGVLPESVVVNQTDTSTCPWDVGTHASRGAFMACNAALLAADKLRARVFEAAAEVYAEEVARGVKRTRRKDPTFEPPAFDIEAAVRANNFELRDGILFLRDHPDERWLHVEFPRLLRAIHFRDAAMIFTVEAFYEPPTQLPDWSRGIGNMSANYAYGTQGAEVEVDTETGEVRILRMAAAHDVGRVLHPVALKGQIYGALAQGLGYALYEEVRTDRGKMLNPNFTDYKIPTAFDIPDEIIPIIVEVPQPDGPFGARGVGEHTMIGAAPVIANAVYNALGVRITSMPITQEKIAMAVLDEPKT